MYSRPRDFRVLGALEVVDDGRTIELGGRRQRALLALLLLNANETLSTDRLIDDLWDVPPAGAAAKTVQMTVSRLRKALGSSGSVVTRDGGYELRVDPGWIDAYRFEELLVWGRSELAAGRSGSAAGQLETALSLWRGPALAGLADYPFARIESGRLEGLRLAAQEELIEAKLALGRHSEVVGELEVLIGEHAYRERLRAQLMLALYRSDRQADALQAYQDARKTLVDELGIEPSERLRELERAVLAQDAALALPAVEAEPVRDAPLVGRRPELGALTDALDAAFRGNGGIVLVGGEAGIGKTSLAEAIMDRARGCGARVLVGRCWEAGGAPSYWPWVQALRMHLRDADPEVLRAQLGNDARYLAAIVPEIRDLLGLDAVPAIDSEASRFRVLEGVSAFLRRLASAQPVALFLDDLHAADVPSLLLLRFVADDLVDAAILVVGCYRDAEAGPAFGELARAPHVRDLELGGLSASETSRLIEMTVGDRPAGQLAARIHAETRGNPLFATEIARLVDRDDPHGRLPVPRGAREVFGRRLERQSEQCREVLAVASVLGREFDPHVVGQVCKLADDELFRAIEEASTARLVEGIPEGGDRLRFSHVLIRDALYDALTVANRTRLHRAIASALEARYAANLVPHVAELAHHYLAAGTPVADKAVEYSRAAGGQAVSVFAYQEAATHYSSALRVVETTGAGNVEMSCELLVSLGEALSRGGRGPEANETLLRAAELADRSGRPDLVARAALEYGGRFAWARASSDPALVPLLQRALTAVGEEASVQRARLLARLAGALRDEPQRDRRARLGEQAVEVARRIGDERTLVFALEAHFIAVEGPDTVGPGLDLGARLIALGEQTGDKERVFAGLDHRLKTFWQLGDRAGVDVELARMRTVAGELRQPVQRWHVGTGETMVALMEGRFDEAEERITATRALGERATTWNAVVTERLALFVLRREQGRLAELEDALKRSMHEYPALLRFRCALAHLYAELGREAEARAMLAPLLASNLAHEHVDAEWAFSMTVLAEPCALVADQSAMAKLYAVLAPYERLYAQAPVEAVFGSVARGLGVLATALRRFEDAERHFGVALDVEGEMRAVPWLAHARHGLAAMLLARDAPGDGDRAQALLTDAVATYRDLAMEAWVDRAARLAPTAKGPAAGPLRG